MNYGTPTRDETGTMIARLSINELIGGEIPIELWLRRGRLVVRAYNEGGCAATEIDAIELIEILRGDNDRITQG